MTAWRMRGAVFQQPILANAQCSFICSSGSHGKIKRNKSKIDKEILKLYVMVWLCAIQIWKKNNILYSFLNTTNILFWTFNTEIQYVQIYIILVLYMFNVVTWLNAAYYLLLILLLSLSSLFHVTHFFFFLLSMFERVCTKVWIWLAVCFGVFLFVVFEVGCGVVCGVCLLSEWDVCVGACCHTMISIWIKVETPCKPGWPCLHQRTFEKEREMEKKSLTDGGEKTTRERQRRIELLKKVCHTKMYFKY